MSIKDALQQLNDEANSLSHAEIRRRIARIPSTSLWEPPDYEWERPKKGDNAKAAVVPMMKPQPKVHARPPRTVIPPSKAFIRLWPKKIQHSVAVNRKYYIAATLFNLVLWFRGQPQMSKLRMGRLEPVNRGSLQM